MQTANSVCCEHGKHAGKQLAAQYSGFLLPRENCVNVSPPTANFHSACH
jgi:hypothetical protein